VGLRRKFNGAQAWYRSCGYQKTEYRSQDTEGKMKKRIESFEDLEVFQRAYRISLEIHKQSLDFPREEQRGLADQIRRASKSVCANTAEGFGKQRYSSSEFKRYLMIAIGSSDEMRVWLRYCLDLGYIDKKTWMQWSEEYREIARMLHGLCKNWE
jgi:four helix bundle protein